MHVERKSRFFDFSTDINLRETAEAIVTGLLLKIKDRSFQQLQLLMRPKICVKRHLERKT